MVYQPNILKADSRHGRAAVSAVLMNRENNRLVLDEPTDVDAKDELINAPKNNNRDSSMVCQMIQTLKANNKWI